MIKRIFTNIYVFLTVFFILAVSASLYYYGRVIQKDSHNQSQISYSDFRVYWFASFNFRHFISSETDRYKVYNREKEKFYHFRYSPFVAFAMLPFGKMPHQGHALLIWYAILNLLLLSALLLLATQLARDFGLSPENKYIVLWGAFIGGLRFYLMNISLGQTDILILFLFVLFLLSHIRKNEIFSGAFLALILQFKLFFLPILFYFLITKRFKTVASTLICFVALLFVPSCLLGIEKTLELLRDWIEILGVSLPSQLLNSKNQSFVYSIANIFLKNNAVKNFFASPKELFYTLSMGLTLPFYILLARFKKAEEKRDKKAFGYLEVSLLIISSLLFSPIAWKAHFMSLVIPVSFAILLARECGKKALVYPALGAFFILACVIGTDLTKFVPHVNEQNLMNIAFGTLALGFALVSAYRLRS